MVDNNKIFETQDLYLASFLKARGLSLIKIGKKGSIAIFYFEYKEDIKRIVTGFYNDKELVSAYKLIGSIRDLKSIVHNLKNEV